LAGDGQCNGGSHPFGALPTSVAELGSKAEVAAMVSGGAEVSWKEWSKPEPRFVEKVSNDDVMKAIQSNNMAAVGEVLFDCGRGESDVCVCSEEESRGDVVREQSESRKEKESISITCQTEKQSKSQQYIAARRNRNERRRQKRKQARKRNVVKIGSTPTSECLASCAVIACDECSDNESMPDLRRVESSDDETVDERMNDLKADNDSTVKTNREKMWPGLNPPTVSSGE
jgi:hypothetical protein